MEKLIISRKDIVSNLETLRKYAKVQLIGVVDQNGYGCGSRYLARTFISSGVQLLAAFDVNTVNSILDEFPEANVLLLCPVFGMEELACVIHRGAIATVASVADAVRLDAAAEEAGVSVRVHLLIRSHKNGCGLSPSEAEGMAEALHTCHNLEVDGAYTHIDPTDALKEKRVLRQKKVYDETVENLTGAGIRIPVLHMADGYSALRYPSIGYNAVRVGDVAIGRMEGKDRWHLTPVGHIETPLIGNISVYQEEEGSLKGKGKTFAVALLASREAVMATCPMSTWLSGKKRITALYRGKKIHGVNRYGSELMLMDMGHKEKTAEETVRFSADPRLVNGDVEREYL